MLVCAWTRLGLCARGTPIRLHAERPARTSTRARRRKSRHMCSVGLMGVCAHSRVHTCALPCRAPKTPPERLPTLSRSDKTCPHPPVLRVGMCQSICGSRPEGCRPRPHLPSTPPPRDLLSEVCRRRVRESPGVNRRRGRPGDSTTKTFTSVTTPGSRRVVVRSSRCLDGPRRSCRDPPGPSTIPGGRRPSLPTPRRPPEVLSTRDTNRKTETRRHDP